MGCSGVRVHCSHLKLGEAVTSPNVFPHRLCSHLITDKLQEELPTSAFNQFFSFFFFFFSQETDTHGEWFPIVRSQVYLFVLMQFSLHSVPCI